MEGPQANPALLEKRRIYQKNKSLPNALEGPAVILMMLLNLSAGYLSG